MPIWIRHSSFLSTQPVTDTYQNYDSIKGTNSAFVALANLCYINVLNNNYNNNGDAFYKYQTSGFYVRIHFVFFSLFYAHVCWHITVCTFSIFINFVRVCILCAYLYHT